MLTLFATAFLLVVGVPAAIFAIECVASLLPPRARPRTFAPPPRVAILMPAHDEEASLGATLESLARAVDAGAELLVVADNCRDRTAAIAEAFGARVVRRDDPARRGKGYAIERGVAELASDPPDVVIVVDADCRIDAASIEAIAARAHAERRPIQSEYALEPGSASFIARTSAFAFSVRNRVRARGLSRAGAPVPLTGTGMAFPFRLLHDVAPSLGGHLAEDLLLGVELSIAGAPPALAEGATVTSALPSSPSASRRQRARWEGGSLAVARTHAPRLLFTGLRARRPGLVALALDVSVPPLALLGGAALVVFAAAALVAALGGPIAPLAIASIPAGLLALGVGVAWWSVGRRVLPLRQLVCAPLYVAWKLPLYAALALRGAPARWERTARRGD